MTAGSGWSGWTMQATSPSPGRTLCICNNPPVPAGALEEPPCSFKPGSIPFNSFRDSGPREVSADVALDADISQAAAIMAAPPR